MTLLRPWWELYPGVLDEEEADLERLAGRAPALNEELLERAQIREYDTLFRVGGETFELTVTFADLHPFFRPEVSTKQPLGSHQHPFTGDLCLLQGGTWHWDVSETAAQLIESQLPRLLGDVRPAPEASAA